MKGKLAIYRYDDIGFPKFKYGYYLEGLGNKIVITLVFSLLIHYLKGSTMPPLEDGTGSVLGTLIGAILLTTLISKVFTSQKAGIIVSSYYVLFGEQTVLYQNIKTIRVDEKNLTFSLERQDGRLIEISADKFHTNANKPHKIKKNKQDKYYKVVGKILEHATLQNPDVTREISAAKRFKKYIKPDQASQ